MACSLSRNRSASSILPLKQRAEKESHQSDAHNQNGVQAEFKRKESKFRLWVGGWLVKRSIIPSWVNLENLWGLEAKFNKWKSARCKKKTLFSLRNDWVGSVGSGRQFIAVSVEKRNRFVVLFLTYHMSDCSSCGCGKRRPYIGKWHAHS